MSPTIHLNTDLAPCTALIRFGALRTARKNVLAKTLRIVFSNESSNLQIAPGL
jgi:hypothetical protein